MHQKLTLYPHLQMKQLEQQQEREERELMERVANGEVVPAAAGSPSGKTAVGGPVRSQSGNDLASFGDNDEEKKSKYANAKSMPGSRRHSGEMKGDAASAGKKGTDGQPMLNSFLFDDELDTDIQSELRR